MGMSHGLSEVEGLQQGRRARREGGAQEPDLTGQDGRWQS